MEKWEKIASDYHCYLWKNYCFVKGVTLESSLIDIPQICLGIRAWPKTIDYLYLPKTWKAGNKKLAKLVGVDISLVDKILNKTEDNGRKMNSFTERFILDDLAKYPNKKIIECLKKHMELNSLEYAWGVLIPVLDFHNSHYIEDNLKVILEKYLNKVEARRAFSVFTQPIKDSFARAQEKSILRIYRKIPKKLLKINTCFFEETLRKKNPATYRKLKEHTKKYAWVFYVYSGPVATEKDFVETLKYYEKSKIAATNKLRKMERERKKLLEERKYYFQKMKMSNKEKKLVELAAKVVYLKSRRKDYQSKSYYHMEFLQKEIGKRLHLSLSQVRACTFEEIKAALQGEEIDVHVINERMHYHIVVPVRKEIKVYSGEEAKRYERHIKEEKVKIRRVKKIEGQVAFSGKAKGRVKRIDMPEDMKKMKEGDILVSTATTPSIVPAIRKAAAIVTDEGGLTCHAAIVSREFGIPCVVGTNFATRILKDGDQVEVDAYKGIVKRIK